MSVIEILLDQVSLGILSIDKTNTIHQSHGIYCPQDFAATIDDDQEPQCRAGH